MVQGFSKCGTETLVMVGAHSTSALVTISNSHASVGLVSLGLQFL